MLGLGTFRPDSLKTIAASFAPVRDRFFDGFAVGHASRDIRTLHQIAATLFL
jgi:hypothetical protein